jgi:hypothetical protein
MLCSGELTSWASLILDSLDDTVTPTGSVVVWLKSNLGYLNLRLGEEFVLSGDCIVPDMSQNVSGIYTEMYYCYYYNKQANKNLGSSAYDWTEIMGQEQGSVRKVSKNEVAKTYRTLAKDCRERLDELTKWYSEGKSPVSPTQILYGDRFGGANFDLLPPPSCISACNFIW